MHCPAVWLDTKVFIDEACCRDGCCAIFGEVDEHSVMTSQLGHVLSDLSPMSVLEPRDIFQLNKNHVVHKQITSSVEIDVDWHLPLCQHFVRTINLV